MTVPKISCLTITRNRPDMLRRAVDYYARQTWPNKELIVVVDSRGDTDWVEPFFKSLGRSDVRYAVPPPVEHLGALRNVTVDMAAGELVATWDDDDLYHADRLETQARAMLAEGADACFLIDSLEYFEDSRELIMVEWPDIGLPPSMLARKTSLTRYQDRITDPQIGQKGSDTLVQQELMRSKKVLLLRGDPHLYTRIYHGANVWNRWHHVQVAFSRALEPTVLQGRIPGIAPRLGEYFPFPIPDAVLAKDGSKIPLSVG